MASNKSRAQSEVPQFFVVNEAARANLARRFLEFQQKKQKQIQERNATLLQMAKYLGEVQGEAKPSSRDPKTAKALKGLLGIHEKLANQKLAPPRAALGIGGVNYTVTVSPPYDYYPKPILSTDPEVSQQPILTGSADPTAGQLSTSAVTSSQPGYSGGDTYVTLGIYFPFVPPMPGTLTAYANPVYSFECWTESYFPPNSNAPLARARSFLSGSLNIYGTIPGNPPPTYETVAGQQFFSLNQQTPSVQAPGPLLLEDGFNLQTSVSVSTPVDPSQAYMIFVSVETLANGYGSLGSIAGAMLSVTVPSITYNFVSPAGPGFPLPGR
ncbi:MAG: hypothetical protein WA261_18695 [Candidatus Sulfotelmatobacter sp.]